MGFDEYYFRLRFYIDDNELLFVKHDGPDMEDNA